MKRSAISLLIHFRAYRSMFPNVPPPTSSPCRPQPVIPPLSPPLSSTRPPHTASVEMGGAVTTEQCRTLAAYLSPSAGGQYLLPTACSKLLLVKANADDQSELASSLSKDEKSGDFGGRLKRRKTVVAKECFPPTVC